MPIRIAITGAAGQIGYALLFRIASGQMFGADTPVCLHLIEVEQALPRLEGVVMELEDGAFPLIKEIKLTADLKEGFREVNWALLIGSFPRKAGMERSDLMKKNAGIFIKQGKALEQYAANDIRIVVVGNPCNTNCLVALNNAPSIPKDRWFAMTRLDENRARSQLATKAQVALSDIQNVTIFGNHSSTMYADFYNAKIKNRPVLEVIHDESWLKETFLEQVAQRGARIIEARGASSAASAANALIDTVTYLHHGKSADDWHSVGVYSQGAYGLPEGIITSLPICSDGKICRVVENLSINEFAQAKIDRSIQELLEERSAVGLT